MSCGPAACVRTARRTSAAGLHIADERPSSLPSCERAGTSGRKGLTAADRPPLAGLQRAMSAFARSGSDLESGFGALSLSGSASSSSFALGLAAATFGGGSGLSAAPPAAGGPSDTEAGGGGGAAVAVTPGCSVCSNCGREIPEENMRSHTLHCARNVAKCKMCGEVVSLRDMDAHVDGAKGTAYVPMLLVVAVAVVVAVLDSDEGCGCRCCWLFL